MKNVISQATINFIKKTYQRPDIIDNPACYFYDLRIVGNNIENLKQFAPSQISLYYAMKANPNKKIMSYISNVDFVKGVEIASSGELDKALQFFESEEIIFTGPGKTEKELECAIKAGIRLINVESVVEAIRINDIARRLGVAKVDILLRINVNYYISDAREYMAGLSTKMGIDENKYIESFKFINNLSKINIKGIHVFAASGVLNYDSLIRYVKYVFDLVSRLDKTTKEIDIINFGGGIGIDYTNENRVFDVKSYFDKLTALINFYGYENKEIILELGTYIVGNAGFYTSKIIDIKEIKGRKHIILAGGINHMALPLETGKKHPVHIIDMHIDKLYPDQTSVNKEVADISGPLCMNTDKLSWDDYIDRANIGDIVVFRQAGAYGYSLSMPEFLSHPYPKEIFIADSKS